MIRAVPILTATSTVSELMAFLRYAIFDDQFGEVETILTNRENDFKAKLEKLQKSHDALKQELFLLEKKQSLAELEKLMSVEDLRKCEQERDELSEKLVKLNEDHQAMSDREKRGEERCRKLMEQLLEAEMENNRLILGFSEKFEALKRKMGEVLKLDKDKRRIVVDFAEIRKLLKRKKCETPGEKTENDTSDSSVTNGGLGDGVDLRLCCLPKTASCNSYEKVVPSLTETSSVTELITILRHAFRDDDFKQVETVLTNRENGFKMEVEGLLKLHEVLKEEHDLMEKKHGLAELEKLKFEDELRNSRRESDELKEKLLRLNEDHEKVTALGKMSKERCQKLEEQFLEAEKEKNRVVVEFNEKFEALKREKLAMEREMEKLLLSEKEKSEIIAQCNEKIKVLGREKCQVEEKMEAYKNEFSKLNEKVLKLEDVITSLKSVDTVAVKDGDVNVAEGKACEEKQAYFRASSDGEESSASGVLSHRANVNLKKEIPDSSLPKRRLGNSDGAGLNSSRACIWSSSPRTGSCDSQKKDLHPTGLACGNELPTGKWLNSEAGGSNKLIHPSKEITGRLGSAAIFIDLSASDDDMPIGRNAKANNFGENGMASVKSEKNRYSSLENIKIISGCSESHPRSTTKRKRSTSESESDNHVPIAKLKRKHIIEFCDGGERSPPAVRSRMPNPVAPDVAEAVSPSMLNLEFIKRCEKAGKEQNHQLPVRKPTLDGVDGSSYNSACSGDHSYEDINVNVEVINFQGSRGTTWIYAADMLSAIKKDPELCMSAVCALYRQEISAHKSTRSFSLLKERGFCPLDVIKGSALAKYLIANDPENKLRRSVSEVRKELPEMLDDCERLATQYYEQLFDIYQKKLDPYFCPKL